MTEIAKAYVQIIPTTKGVKNNLDEELKKATQKSGEKAGEATGGGFIKQAGAAILKGAGTVAKVTAGVFATVAAAAAPAIAALTKQSVEAYADYEQLVGGVETLFGVGGQSLEEFAKAQGKAVDEVSDAWWALTTGQRIVLNNAEEAYKTAGLSANEYMETVTSFSAALVSSLGGDTKAAAQAADVAITDMADNANKMGSSMESIQNAYQGFAKQNYTMLDNLKLGYGGTKEEMARLLADAEKFSGVKYDISNLNDVYSAIHVVQTELGITGTTAKEASATISGSAATMKAAWQNLLVGIADDDPEADLNSLVSNLVESVGTFADNIIPRIQTALSGIGELVAQLAPVIVSALPGLVEAVVPGLLDSVLSMVTAITAVLPELLTTFTTTIITFFTEHGPELITAGVTALTSIITGLSETLPQLIPVAVDAVITIVESLIDNIDMLVDAAIKITMALANGLIDALPRLIEKAPEIITKLVTALVENAPKLAKAAFEVIVSLAKAIIQNLPQIIKAALEIVKSFISGIGSAISKIWEVGKNIVEGVWQGIKNAAAAFTAKVKNFFKGIVDGVKNFLGIHSPSRVFRDQIGKQMAAGVGLGFADEMSSVRRDMVNEMNGLTNDVATISTSFDTNITPISGGNDYFNNGINRIIAAMRDLNLTARLSLDSRDIRYGQQKLERAIG